MPEKKSAPTFIVHMGDDIRSTDPTGVDIVTGSIKNAYPDLSHISADLATIRVTDRKTGYRWVYWTPPEAQHAMLCFDQGLPIPSTDFILNPDNNKKEEGA